jgi:hypothetical protein
VLALQAEIARKFFAFVPGQHHRRGIITPIDQSFSTVFLNDFLAEHVFGSETWEQDAVQTITRIINPVKTLMQDTKVCDFSILCRDSPTLIRGLPAVEGGQFLPHDLSVRLPWSGSVGGGPQTDVSGEPV